MVSLNPFGKFELIVLRNWMMASFRSDGREAMYSSGDFASEVMTGMVGDVRDYSKWSP
ncbi:MAG: hypothetical protein HKP47_02920, partial [Eudoraea sp.]|nr:hypothetical protein [Eudoraea sp.]